MFVFDKQANLGKFTVPIAVLRNFELKLTNALFRWVFFLHFFTKKTLISSKVTVADTVLYNFHIKKCIDVLCLFLTNKPI